MQLYCTNSTVYCNCTVLILQCNATVMYLQYCVLQLYCTNSTVYCNCTCCFYNSFSNQICFIRHQYYSFGFQHTRHSIMKYYIRKTSFIYPHIQCSKCTLQCTRFLILCNIIQIILMAKYDNEISNRFLEFCQIVIKVYSFKLSLMKIKNKCKLYFKYRYLSYETIFPD